VIRVWPEPVRHDHSQVPKCRSNERRAGPKPPDTLWVSEAGSNELAITTAIRPANLISHLTAAGEGLGFGLAVAVGAQLAAPDRAAFPRRTKAEPATPILVISLIVLSVGSHYRPKRIDV
jgi:hypothetical protein